MGLAERLRGGPTLLPVHCSQDKLCQPHMPGIRDLYAMLEQCFGVQVRWVHGRGPDYHKLDHEILDDPDSFLRKLASYVRPEKRGRMDVLPEARRRLSDQLLTLPSARQPAHVEPPLSPSLPPPLLPSP